MKKIFSLAAAAALSANLFAEVITIGATPVPHAEILEEVAKVLKEQGHELKITEFNDYILPNLAVDDGELDANFFQHKPYLDEFNKQKSTKLTAVLPVHLEPMGAYSRVIKDIKDLKDGALVYVPNDPTNESRALDILEKAGLIKLDSSVELKTPIDVIENPKNIVIKELEAAQLPRVLDECDLAVINSNYAIPANLKPNKDAVLLESKDSPYANNIVVKTSDIDSEKTKILIKAIKTDRIKNFILDKYKGEILPSF